MVTCIDSSERVTTPPRYLSLFSGVGGLEHPDAAPMLACEVDPNCQKALQRQYPDTEVWPDVRTLQPPAAAMVVGGLALPGPKFSWQAGWPVRVSVWVILRNA